MRHLSLFLSLAMVPMPVVALNASPRAVVGAPSDASLSTPFTVDSKTLIPGKVLAPGEYTISIVDHLTDRVILRIADKSGKVQSTFLGLTSSGVAGSASGPILWTGNGKGSTALRGFRFPGAPPVEFVYPKTQAVAIAKANPEKVLAVDPASDNLSIQNDKLSNQDMQIVTLWTLKSTRVGPDSQPGIEAAKYQPPTADPAVAPAPPTYVARANPPADRPAPRGGNSAARTQAPSTSAATAEPAPKQPRARKPSIAVLPHTASNLPAIYLSSLLAFLAAAGLKVRRLYADEA